MIVEAEVKERLSASTCRINEAYLVEAHVSLVAWRKTFHLFLRNQTKGACYLRLAEQTNTCRVGADSGNICSKSIHSSTHTHIACSTVKLVFYEIGILVSFLCKGRRSCESHSCHKQYLCFHIIFFFFISSKNALLIFFHQSDYRHRLSVRHQRSLRPSDYRQSLMKRRLNHKSGYRRRMV